MADKKDTNTTAKTTTIELPVQAFLPSGFLPVQASATEAEATFEDADGKKHTVGVARFQLPDGVAVQGARYRAGRAARLLLEVTGAKADMAANVSVNQFGANVEYHEVK